MASRTMWPAVGVAGLLTVAGCQVSEPVADYDGRNLFLSYCASCHGVEGRGDGPVAPAMSVAMADLRTLEARHGVFPHDWVEELIDGRTQRAAHGTLDMPVWGWQFRLVEESPARADARISALVDYLAEIQIQP